MELCVARGLERRGTSRQLRARLEARAEEGAPEEETPSVVGAESELREAARAPQPAEPTCPAPPKPLALLDVFAATTLVFATDFLSRTGQLEHSVFDACWGSCRRCGRRRPPPIQGDCTLLFLFPHRHHQHAAHPALRRRPDGGQPQQRHPWPDGVAQLAQAGRIGFLCRAPVLRRGVRTALGGKSTQTAGRYHERPPAVPGHRWLPAPSSS